ncbi:MAG TPA: hypothetical protein VNO21_12505 [Polyangiaceae bacterium]|nr:hypothetical protein [Polyangiaceae bacterium]
MQALKAHVQNGRLVLDEPTDLPEGEVVELVPVDDSLAIDNDDLEEEEREALDAELEAGVRELDEGLGVSEEELWARLRANR